MSGLLGHRGPLTRARSDPYWASVVSLLHFDGVNGATDVEDEKGMAWTLTGSAALTTAEKLFGSASLNLPNASGYDGAYAGSNVITPAGNTPTAFTIEGSINVSSLTGFQYGYNPLVSQGGGSSNTDQTFGLFNGRVNYLRASNLLGGGLNLTGTTVVATNTTYRIAMTFDLLKVRLFLNGVLEAEASTPRGWINTGYPVRVGNEIVNGYAAYRFGTKGWVDEVRITRTCRYTADYALAVRPFPEA